MNSVRSKLAILADAAKYDASCASSGGKRKRPEDGIGNAEGMGICHSYTPDGRCVSLLKILLTNYCLYDCLYCVNRISSDTPRARFSINEVVNLTLEFYRRNYIEGLFLSSGIIQNSDYTMEQLVTVARVLREMHGFGGYIHLKTIPNASPELIREAGKWADRLSVNIELPMQSDLDRLAPAKKHPIIEQGMRQIYQAGLEARDASPKSQRKAAGKKRVKAPSFASAGQSTQIIVGATESTDQNILDISSRLYSSYKLKRVYYSAFSPIPHSAPGLPLLSPPLMREHRLYQADWLVRFYGFHHAEILSPDSPNLDLNLDPKVAWAIRNRHLFPVDINTASREMLLRVPGLGTRTVQKILLARRFSALRLQDLLRLRIPFQRTKYFIITADSNSSLKSLDSLHLRSLLLGSTSTEKPKQLSLFHQTYPPQAGSSAKDSAQKLLGENEQERQARMSAVSGEF